MRVKQPGPPGFGYRRVTASLRVAGWHVNHKRVERIWM